MHQYRRVNPVIEEDSYATPTEALSHVSGDLPSQPFCSTLTRGKCETQRSNCPKSIVMIRTSDIFLICIFLNRSFLHVTAGGVCEGCLFRAHLEHFQGGECTFLILLTRGGCCYNRAKHCPRGQHFFTQLHPQPGHLQPEMMAL